MASVSTRQSYDQQLAYATAYACSSYDHQDTHWCDNRWDGPSYLTPMAQALLLEDLMDEDELLDARTDMHIDLCNRLERCQDATAGGTDRLSEVLKLELSEDKLEEINKKCEDIFEERDRLFEKARKQRRAEVREAYEAAQVAKMSETIRASQEVAIEQTQQQVRDSVEKRKKQRRREPPESRLPQQESEHVRALSKVMASIMTPNFRWSWTTKWPYIERGLLHLLFAFKEYVKVREAIENIDLSRVPRQWFKEIQDLWNFSNYNLVDLRKPISQFTPVNTFRIRHKYPCPTWNITGKPKYDIPKIAHSKLKQFYLHTGQRPNRSQKQELARDVGLSYNTVTNWFKNRRQRDKDSAQRQQHQKQDQLSQPEQVVVSSSQASSLESSAPSLISSPPQATSHYYASTPTAHVDSVQSICQQTYFYDATYSCSTSYVSSQGSSSSYRHHMASQQNSFQYPTTTALSPQQIVAQSAQYQTCCSDSEVPYHQYELYGAPQQVV